MKKAVLLVTLLACADETLVDDTPQTIINGDPIPASELPFVGVVKLVTPQGTALCSGSLLSDRVVLTAAHCVPDNRDWTKLSFSLSATFTGATFTPVVDGRVQYLWPGGSQTIVKGDIALLKLATPLPVAQYPLLLPNPEALIPCAYASPCHALTIAGYGLSSTAGTGAGVKRVGRVGLYAWLSAALVETATPSDFAEVVPLSSTLEQACPGDSGGPAFVKASDGRVLIAGVSHAGTVHPVEGPCSTLNLALYSAIHPYRDWIVAKHAELAGLYGDLDRDGKLTTLDLDVWGAGFRTGVFDPVFDIDNDGDVDKTDANHMVLDRVKIYYGDIDGDGSVDGSDFLTWQRLLGKTTGKWTDGDMTFDGKTDGADMDVWEQNYGLSRAIAATSAALGE